MRVNAMWIQMTRFFFLHINSIRSPDWILFFRTIEINVFFLLVFVSKMRLVAKVFANNRFNLNFEYSCAKQNLHTYLCWLLKRQIIKQNYTYILLFIKSKSSPFVEIPMKNSPNNTENGISF